MNIGIILPAEPKKQQQIKLPKFLRVFETLFLDPEPLEVQKIDIFQGLRLVVLGVPLINRDILTSEAKGKKLRHRIRRVFEVEKAWLIGTSEIRGLLGLPITGSTRYLRIL